MSQATGRLLTVFQDTNERDLWERVVLVLAPQESIENATAYADQLVFAHRERCIGAPPITISTQCAEQRHEICARSLWEQSYGPIPPSHIVAFKGTVRIA